MNKPVQRLNDPPPMQVNGHKKPVGQNVPLNRHKKLKGKANRWQELNNFIDVTMRELSPRQVAVWLILFRDCRNGIARTSQSDIATRSGLRRPTVSATIAELEAFGLIQTLHRGGLNRGLSQYRILNTIRQG
jgi:predicted transcriptional regulator